jgi:hypothetical protein
MYVLSIYQLQLQHFDIHPVTFLIINNNSTSELNRASDRRLSTKLEPTFEDRRCRVVSTAVPLRP